MELVIPLAVFLPLGLILISAFTRVSVPNSEREWLLKVLIVAFLARIAVASIFVLFPSLRIFHEDAVGYEYRGMYLASQWRGEVPPSPLPASNYGFYVLSGAIQYVFGRYHVNVSFFNGLVGTLTAYVIYTLTRQLFHVTVARKATLLICFMPSMILWSAIALKDALVTFAIVVSLSSCVTLKQKITLPALLGTIVPLGIIYTTRFYIMYFVVFSILVALAINRAGHLLVGIYKQLFIGGAVAGMFILLGLSGSAQGDTQWFNLEQVSRYRRGMAITAQSGYSQDVDISTTDGALAFLPIGLAHLLLAPFPWQMTSLRALIAAPETMYWWMLFPGMIKGLLFAVRRRFSLTAPVVIFAVSITLAYSLVQGNVGAAFRQRAQIFVFLFVFSALGETLAKVRRAGLSEKLVLASNLSSGDPAPNQA